MNRRTFLAVPALAALAAHGAIPANSTDARNTQFPENKVQTNEWKLWYEQPAEQWLEALPIGNGHCGAMVFGGTAHETLQLNESTLWAGQPHDYTHPGAAHTLPQIRQLIWDNKWGEAQHLIDSAFMGIPAAQLPYQTIGDWNMEFSGHTNVSQYRRELDLNDACVRVSYETNDIQYQREIFASAPDKVIVMRLTADKPGSISFAGNFTSPQTSNSLRHDNQTLILEGTSGNASGIDGAVKYTVAARAIHAGGTVTVTNDTLIVSSADAVTLFLTLGTSFKNYHDISGDPFTAPMLAMDAAAKQSYESLRRRHLRDYQDLFQRMSLDLGTSAFANNPTNQRVLDFAKSDDPQLAALHFQYGRYLLISCSRPGGQPASLQGLWNDSLTPPWGSKYTININTEMNYWPAAPANLVECYEPLFAMMHDISETGSETARVQYGATGWVAHHNTDLWRGTAPVDFSLSGMWPTGGAWLCKSIWDHYEYTLDIAALRRHYPLMKGAAQFFVDTLVLDPHTGYLVTNPSVSPEVPHHAAEGAYVCAGPAMDTQILTDLFSACAKASDILNIDEPFAHHIMELCAKLPPMKIGHLGQLQEWQEDWDASADMHNRHVSHLYWVFPGNGITKNKSKALFEAARKSLELRGDEATGWSLAWKINLWARFGNGDHAYKLLQMLLTPDRTAPNLFDLHPPFQIDGNFGAVSGICEMLVQSHEDDVVLLPALPSVWPTGRIRGIRARHGVELDLEWKNASVTRVSVKALRTGNVRIRSNAILRTKAGLTSEVQPDSSYTMLLSINAGKTVELTAA